MRALLFSLGIALTPAPALASATNDVPTPPPIMLTPHQVASSGLTADQFLLQIPSYRIVCDGAPVQPDYAEDYRVETSRLGLSGKSPVELLFSVATDGRTQNIRPASPSEGYVGGYGEPSTDHEQAVLAASHFGGGPRSNCRLSISYVAQPIAEARQSDLLLYYAVTRTRGVVRDAVGARLAGPDADCGGDRRGDRAPRTVSYPDNRIGKRPPPGGRSWTVVRWNVDASGRAVDVETLGSSGDSAFDAETRRAISETVVEAGAPLKGCLYNFFRTGDVLPAPSLSSRQEDPLQSCPPVVGARFHARIDPESFPKPFRDRNIEGWAIVRFDMATWGQLGNVSVIDAQPAAAFGEAGRRLVQTSQADPAFNAGIRCVVPVNYKKPAARVKESPAASDNAAD